MPGLGVLKLACLILLGMLFAPADEVHGEVRLEVNLQTAALRVVNGGKVIARYPIAVPRHTAHLIRGHPSFPKLPIYGEIRVVLFSPYWHPTPNIREEAIARGRPLPVVVSPFSRNRGNPLGVGFLVVRYPDGRNPRRVVDGIHGNNKAGPVESGARASHGCIRACNQHWLRVAKLVTAELKAGRTVSVVFLTKDDPQDARVRAMKCRTPFRLPRTYVVRLRTK